MTSSDSTLLSECKRYWRILLRLDDIHSFKEDWHATEFYLWHLVVRILFYLFAFSLLIISTGSPDGIAMLLCVVVALFGISRGIRNGEPIAIVRTGQKYMGRVVKRGSKRNNLFILYVGFHVELKPDGCSAPITTKFRIFGKNYSKYLLNSSYRLPKLGEEIEVYYSTAYPDKSYPVISKLFT